MTSAELANLLRIGKLKAEPPIEHEVDGLVRSGEERLNDSANLSLSLGGRFDLAYNAAHALSLAGLRLAGYRTDNRYVVFQVLPHTLGIETGTWRVLADCHGRRNRAEYEGVLDADEDLVAALRDAATVVLTAVLVARDEWRRTHALDRHESEGPSDRDRR